MKKTYVTSFAWIVSLVLSLALYSCVEEEFKHSLIEIVENDPNVVVFQKHKSGKGVMIILMADGYADEIETLYDMYNHLFQEPPYPELKKYFDVVGLLGGESLHLGIKAGNRMYEADYLGVIQSMQRTLGLPSLDNTCIVVAVSTKLPTKRSVTYLCNNLQSPTLALCRWAGCSDEYKTYILAHEVGGHCLAGLEDEYVEFKGVISEMKKKEIQVFQNAGMFENISLSPKDVPWEELSAEKADDVSVIEGGAQYEKGVFRSSPVSIMSTYGTGFNTVGRFLIWMNVHKRAGFSSSLSQFLDYERKNMENIRTRSFAHLNFQEEHEGVKKCILFEKY